MNQLQSRLREEIVRLTRYEASQGPLQAKVLDETERKECSLTHLTYQAVPGRMVKALLVQPQPKNARRKAIPTWTNVARTRQQLPAGISSNWRNWVTRCWRWILPV